MRFCDGKNETKTDRPNDRTTERPIDICVTVNTVKVVHICLRWHTLTAHLVGVAVICKLFTYADTSH